MLTPLLLGALAATSITIALLFGRSWRLSHDRLFLFFALAFVAFALNWIGVALIESSHPPSYAIYLPRLVGFALIIIGVLDKNRRMR